MNKSDERIKRFMTNAGMPESLSLYQAFKQFELEIRNEIELNAKLERKFAESKEKRWASRRNAFVWTSTMGIDGVRYGSFKTVYEDELAKRDYVLESVDWDVGVFYADALFDPRTNTHVMQK